MKRMHPTLLVAFASALVEVHPAAACSCLDPPPLDRAFAASAAVFTGTVLDVGDPGPDPDGDVAVRVLLKDCWKGTSSDTIRILTPANEGVCGFPFHPGTEYLVFAYVFAYQGSGDLYVFLCGRTHQTYAGDPDIAGLGPPRVTPVTGVTWGSVKVRYR
jgi:hypothetical protein